MALVPKKMTDQQTGQATLETLLSFPLVVAALAAITLGIYFNLCCYLVDTWTQESVLCLMQNQKKAYCLRNLKEKTQLLAFTEIKIQAFHRSSSLVVVKVKASWPTQQFEQFSYHQPWPVEKF